MVPQFFLITPEISDVLAIRPQLDALASTGALAVALLRFAGDEAAIRRMATALRAPLQEAGVACLIELPADERLVARLQLDGAHVGGLSRIGAAIEGLKPDRIIGVGALKSRHDAMEAGERDIDYVMFGEPRADGSLPPFEQTLDRATWWAEIFNVPCVAYAPDMTAIAPLARLGAEFIAVGPWLFEADDPASLIAEARRIAKAEALERFPA
jgi:thiamine-phosphate pyrophosphorylase